MTHKGKKPSPVCHPNCKAYPDCQDLVGCSRVTVGLCWVWLWCSSLLWRRDTCGFVPMSTYVLVYYARNVLTANSSRMQGSLMLPLHILTCVLFPVLTSTRSTLVPFFFCFNSRYIIFIVYWFILLLTFILKYVSCFSQERQTFCFLVSNSLSYKTSK